MTWSALEIERRTVETWRAAKTHEEDGWLYLASSGVTGRVNAVWPLAYAGADLDTAIARAEAWFAANGLPARFKITDGACAPPHLPQALQARGYVSVTPTAVMLKPLAAAAQSAAGVELHTTMPPVFDAVIEATSASAEEIDERRSIALRAPQPAAFAVLAGESGSDAIGMSAVAGDLAGIFLMRTRPQARRKGAARIILRTLLSWAESAGARGAFLQVEADNAPAIALYESEGFATLTHYRFWKKAPQ